MSEKLRKPRPSRKPIRLSEDSWYYENRGSIHLISWQRNLPLNQQTHCVELKIPWSKLMESAARCRPEQVKAMLLERNRDGGGK